VKRVSTPRIKSRSHRPSARPVASVFPSGESVTDRWGPRAITFPKSIPKRSIQLSWESVVRLAKYVNRPLPLADAAN